MGGGGCKVIIDYSALRSAAFGLMTRATTLQLSALAGQAADLYEAAYGGWVTALRILDDVGEEGSPTYNEATVKAVIAESYVICDWAAEVRGWSAVLDTSGKEKHAKSAEPYAPDEWCATMKDWIAKDETLLRGIAEAGIDPEYKPEPEA
jgi:hypothetical protein